MITTLLTWKVSIKTSTIVGMTGITNLLDLPTIGVAVAIVLNRFYVLEMAAGLPFQPKLLPGTRKVAGLFLFQGNFQTFSIHISRHEHSLVVVS